MGPGHQPEPVFCLCVSYIECTRLEWSAKHGSMLKNILTIVNPKQTAGLLIAVYLCLVHACDVACMVYFGI